MQQFISIAELNCLRNRVFLSSFTNGCDGMEILSVGEKIKRARIYKGLTLKELCDSMISVSKMSCIENNKVNLEPELLVFFAEKLDLDISYLRENVDSQIEKKLLELEHEPNRDIYEDQMHYLLQVAQQYGYYNCAFNIIHKLFNYYLDSKNKDKLDNSISLYYDICQKSDNNLNMLNYNMDMGRYLLENKEYLQASNYYNSVRRELREKQCHDTLLVKSTYFEAECFIKLEKYERAYEIAVKIFDLIDIVKDNLFVAQIYHMLAILFLRQNKDDYRKYEANSYKYFSDELSLKAESMYDYACVFFEKGNNEQAVQYVNDSLKCYPDDEKVRYVGFILKNIKLLIEHKQYKFAENICDSALNSAIDLNEKEFIEKAYYFKSVILSEKKDFLSAEMYINLSLDVLTKFGTKRDIYERYMEIGNMYYNSGYISEALEYFELAISLEKKI